MAGEPSTADNESGRPPEHGSFTIYGALVANLVIAVAKFIAAAVSGSSALFAEGIHSVVDTGNELLLLVGLRRSRQRPDATHPMGYGRELYFWSLIVAVLLFGVGGGFSIYEGVHRWRHPTPASSAFWSLVVLAVAFVSEGVSWCIAVRALRRRERGATFWQKLHQSKDPSSFVVFAEDSAALLGVLVAAAGVLLSHHLHAVWPDALASIIIGGILCGVAVYLIYETKHLLIGESAAPELVRQVRELAARQPGVLEVRSPASLYLRPDEVVLILCVRFEPTLSAGELARAIDAMQLAIRERHPEMRHIFVDVESAASARAPRAR